MSNLKTHAITAYHTAQDVIYIMGVFGLFGAGMFVIYSALAKVAGASNY